jgi:PAS domain S-box-containing protein
MIGYRDDEIPNEFSTFENRLHPGDKPRVMSYVSNYLKGGIPVYSIEFRLLHRDGTYRWILARGEALCDENGIPHRMAGSHTDVTERVESETRRIESSEFLGTLLDNLNAGVMIVDPKTRIIEEINPKVEGLLGLSRDRIVGTECHRFLCPTEQHSCPILDLNQAMDNSERVMIDSTGREIPILKTVKKVLFGGKVKLLETFVDISDIKRTEERLRASERRWNFALDGAGDGVWDWNAKTGKVFFSRKWKEILGYAEEEIGDTLDEWMTRVHPDDIDRCMREIDRHFRGETESYECEHRIRRKDGTYAWILDRSKIVEHDPSGKPERVIGTHTDVTERVEAENERVLTEARLARAEKLSMLGSLVSGVGHEINNPAAIIMMNTPVLREILDEILPVFRNLCAKNGVETVGKRTLPQTEERLGLLLDGIETGVGRIRDVVRGLRSFSESESAMGVQPVSVVHAAQCAESFLRKPMRDCSAIFSVSYEEGIPEVSGCLHRITQAITSCLENAAESIRGPGKRITLSVRHVRERNVVAVEIRDEGCGIPTEDVSKATEPFFTTKRHDGGVGRGIGLTIVERIMRDHGGSVRIASEPGIGTTVFLEFPVADPNR